MPEESCARCAAKLAPDALWCSLCYAPVPGAMPAAPGAASELASSWPPVPAGNGNDVAADLVEAGFAVSPGTDLDAAVAQLVGTTKPGRHSRGHDVLLVDPNPAAGRLGAHAGVAEEVSPDPAALPGPAKEATGTWPCLGCGTANAMSEDVCAACGLAFLAQAKSPPIFNVPGLGNIFTRPRSEQIGFIVVFFFASLGVLFGLMALLGLIF